MLRVVGSNVMRGRRLWFLIANLFVYGAMLGLFLAAVGCAGLNLILFTSFAILLPWSVLGFCNAAIGLALLFSPGDGRTPHGRQPIASRTAVVMTVRNEDPRRAVARLRIVQQSLDATGEGRWFSFFLLSDTSRAEIARREESEIKAWQAALGGAGERVTYRRRARNFGFKAGNLMDFCERWGDDFPQMVTLDADSLMSAAAILDLVRIMQTHPNVGIVQGLVTGRPSASLFARIFQFGMRHGMRSYTLGQAWWTGECGPFWGHNAIIRIAPFRTFCRLPELPGDPPFGGDILSHDQVEAALMRRGGFEVRLQPVAGGSWEDNPPTILDYIRRDLRWCQGNLQYLRLLAMPGLHPVSRFHLAWAILMFIGVPAWTVTIALLPFVDWSNRSSPWLAMLYGLYLLMYLSPKLAGYVHTAASRRRRARYGGLPRFVAAAMCEIVFSLLQFSITSLHVTAFIVALMAGQSSEWGAQVRDRRAVSWHEATRAFWPQTVFGLVLHSALLAHAAWLIPWVLPFTLGYVLAIPFAVVTAHGGLGNWCARYGFCAVPEERQPPPELIALRGVEADLHPPLAVSRT